MVSDIVREQFNSGTYKYGFDNRKFQLIVFFVSLSMALFSLIFAEENEVYGCINILPFVYAFVTLFLGNMYVHLFYSPVTILLIGGFFVQLVLTPCLFALGGYASFFNSAATDEGVFEAVVLLSLECLVVLPVANRYVSSVREYGFSSIELNAHGMGRLKIFLCMLVSFLIFAYVTIPAISSIYLFPFDIEDLSKIVLLRWDAETIVERGTGDRYIYSLFTFAWPFTRSLLQALVVYLAYSSSRSGVVQRLLIIFSLFVPSLLLSGDNVAPIYGLLIGLLLNMRTYGRKIMFLFTFFAGGCLVSIFLMFVEKMIAMSNWSGISGLSSIAYTLQAYFPGFDNIAMIMQIDNANKLETFLYDIYYTIPFKETIFGLHGNRLYDMFTQVSGRAAHIVPWIAQLAHYFTIPGGVILTAWLMKYVYRIEKRCYSTDNFWEAYIFLGIAISLTMGIFTYSVSIVLRGLVNVWLPIFVILKLCRLV